MNERNEFTPRPALRLVSPPTVEAPAPLDYAQASTGELRRAHAIQLTRLITADIGHFVLKGVDFAHQLYAILRGEDEQVDWDPDVTGVRPDLDEQERLATEHLQAIWRETSLRRSVRQGLRNRYP